MVDGAEFATHDRLDRSTEEYLRDGFKHSNTVESYFSILRRGVYGNFHRVSEARLRRYLDELPRPLRAAFDVPFQDFADPRLPPRSRLAEIIEYERREPYGDRLTSRRRLERGATATRHGGGGRPHQPFPVASLRIAEGVVVEFGRLIRIDPIRS
jgi:hypothetical protein